MVYGRIFYNNIKEYTPTWIKTIPYSQITKTTLGRRPQVVSRLNADPKVKKAWRWLQRNVQKNVTAWQVFLFLQAYTLCMVCEKPWLFVYQTNNRHRTLDYAIQKEKEYKQSQESGAESE